MDFIYTNCIEHFQQYITLCNDISTQHMYNQYRVHLSISLNNLISTNNLIKSILNIMQQNTNMNSSNLLKIFTTMNMTITISTSVYFLNIYLLVNLISHTGVNKTTHHTSVDRLIQEAIPPCTRYMYFMPIFQFLWKRNLLQIKQFHSIRSTDLLSILLHIKTLHSIVDRKSVV